MQAQPDHARALRVPRRRRSRGGDCRRARGRHRRCRFRLLIGRPVDGVPRVRQLHQLGGDAARGGGRGRVAVRAGASRSACYAAVPVPPQPRVVKVLSSPPRPPQRRRHRCRLSHPSQPTRRPTCRCGCSLRRSARTCESSSTASARARRLPTPADMLPTRWVARVRVSVRLRASPGLVRVLLCRT